MPPCRRGSRLSVSRTNDAAVPGRCLRRASRWSKYFAVKMGVRPTLYPCLTGPACGVRPKTPRGLRWNWGRVLARHRNRPNAAVRRNGTAAGKVVNMVGTWAAITSVPTVNRSCRSHARARPYRGRNQICHDNTTRSPALSGGAIRKVGIASHRLEKLKKNKKEKRKKKSAFFAPPRARRCPCRAVAPPPVPAAPGYGVASQTGTPFFEIL
jgi:hypothetical protein